ncbi:GMC oxidoreductase [Streptomyces sp. NPDC005531]|uniref:GMC oxidoreductase n=1 Tax=Streptomyces sp. NPDC005531 TaxID=3364722 RepID=UPI00368DA8A7
MLLCWCRCLAPPTKNTGFLQSYRYNHFVGTCRIGTEAHAMVDPHLRVHGISDLRIADASVMPSIVSGATNATVLAMAERAATAALEVS